MSDDKEQDIRSDQAKRRFGRRWLLLVGAALAAILCCLVWKAGWWDFRSVDERLTAIDAELAIPDSENAAVYFGRFLADPDNAAILDDLSDLTPSAYVEPWADSEHPELAAELEQQRAFMQTLFEIFQVQKARFAVCPGPSNDSWQMLPDMRRLTFVLSWAAANDLAEGRIDAACGKYRCQFRLARHLQQQPATYYNSVGIAIEAVAAGNIRRAVMRGEIAPERLSSLELILEEPWNLDEVDAEITARVDRLIEEKQRSQLPFAARFKQWLRGRRSRRQREQRQRLIRLRLQAIRRATPILIALRRHKERGGCWPETLEQIEPKLSAQVLIDPQNNGPFVYERQDGGFVFYSKGPNGADEGGSSSGPADDWPIWPLKIETVPAAGK